MIIAIVGLGLIGGSFAKAIKSKTNHTVIAADNDSETLNMAIEEGIIANAEFDLGDADIILVALYPRQAVKYLQDNAVRIKKGAIVVDLCGVKRYVCVNLANVFPSGVHFIGGHPMAGRECFGYKNSIPTLFNGASMILTPQNDEDPQIISQIGDFFKCLGFTHIEITTPEHHDEMIAYTSQLAHIVSSAYVKSPISRGYMGFSAGSFADMTRVAKLNETMWCELFLENADYLINQIAEMTDNLHDFKHALERGDAGKLTQLLKDGRIIKETIEKNKVEI